MNVALWAEIRRLAEIERLSQRAIAQRLHCTRRSVRKALATTTPPAPRPRGGSRLLEPYRSRIDALIAQHPQLSAVRVHEEIARGPDGFQGSVRLLRHYLKRIRPTRRRVYQEVLYAPGDAMQVDWADCGTLRIGQTTRRVSVFVAVLCYSRLMYIEFCLSQKKAEFYRAIVAALHFFAGSPRKIIFDNLKAAVLSGAGRRACLHPEFQALCGHFLLQPIACEPRDPESKGIVEAGVRYLKHNALAGRAEQLVTWDDYRQFATDWRDSVANLRVHHTTQQRPIDRYQEERPHLRPLPDIPYDTDETLTAIVTPQARIRFDANRYSVPPQFIRQVVTIRADTHRVRVLAEGSEIARHPRSYEKGRNLALPEHQAATLQQRRRASLRPLEQEFDALGPEAREFHLQLVKRPVKAARHLRRLLGLVRLYGKTEVLAAIAQALHYQTYDAAYVETLLHQQRRRQQLPSPTPLCPKRRELIEDIQLDEPDPAAYDRFLHLPPGEPL